MLSAQQESRLIGYLDQEFLRHTSHSNKLTKLPNLEDFLLKLEGTINFLNSIPATESSIHIAYLLQLTSLLPQTLVNYSPPTPVAPLFDFLTLLDANWADVLSSTTQTDRIRLRSLLEEVERALREHLGISRKAGRADVGGEVVEPRFEALPRLKEMNGMEIDEEGAEVFGQRTDDPVEPPPPAGDDLMAEQPVPDESSDSEVEFDAVAIPPHTAPSYDTAHQTNEQSFSINLGSAPPPSVVIDPLQSSVDVNQATDKIEREPEYDDTNPTSRAGKIIDGDASDSASEDEDAVHDDERESEEEDEDGQAIMLGLETLFAKTCRALDRI